MNDWNVVVTFSPGRYLQALSLVARYGPNWPSQFPNVLTLKTGDIPGFLEGLGQALAADPRGTAVIGRAIPSSQVFDFHSPEEFMARAGEILASLADQVAGRGFHTRLHRRGFKRRIVTPLAEQSLNDLLLETTSRRGRPATLTFSDPEVIVALETVGPRAGISLWNREQRLKYPFLRLD
jgi:tRNA(Ser,Leu) C12 N-acetylase TAN1